MLEQELPRYLDLPCKKIQQTWPIEQRIVANGYEIVARDFFGDQSFRYFVGDKGVGSHVLCRTSREPFIYDVTWMK